CRQVVGRDESVQRYGIMNDPPCNCSKGTQKNQKLAQIFGLNEQNAEVYTALSSENRALVRRLDDYYSQHKKLKKKVKRLEKYVDEHLNWLRDDI
ncbi:2292_t:CDS:2, partial [Funneliformis geosporum]